MQNPGLYAFESVGYFRSAALSFSTHLMSLITPIPNLRIEAAGAAVAPPLRKERERFVTRQPPRGGKDDFDGEDWISDGLPSISRRRRRGEGMGGGLG